MLRSLDNVLARLSRRAYPTPLAARTGSARNRQRLLFIGPAGFRPGVWETRVEYIFPDLFEPLVQSGAEITMLVGPIPKHATAGIERLKSLYGAQILEAPPTERGMKMYEHWIKHSVQAAIQVRPDVVTNVFGATSFGIGIGVAARTVSARSVLRIAGDEIASRLAINNYRAGDPEHQLDDFTERTGFNLVDQIIVMSEQEKRRIEEKLVRDVRVVVRPRGIDLSRFSPLEGFSEARPRKRFCFVGRKSFEKGYDIVEEAARIVAEADPEIAFSFAGTFEPGESGNVRYAGFVRAEDLPAFYGANDAFILCSRNEGFPQAVMEAMAMGKPSILSRHIFENIYENERDALLVEPRAEAVAAAILRLAREPQLGSALASRAREIAERDYDGPARRRQYRDTILGFGQ